MGVTTGVGQMYTGNMVSTGMTTGMGMTTGASGLVVRNDTTDLNGDGITTANEAHRFASGERRVDMVSGVSGGMIGGGLDTGMQASGNLVVRNDTTDLDGDGITTAKEAHRFASGERRVDMVGGY